MSVSVLLRLLPVVAAEPGSAAAPVLRGQAEVVETGETALFKDELEMLAFLSKVTDSTGDAIGGEANAAQAAD